MTDSYLDEKIQCPHCDHVEILQGYDVLGADDGCVFCNQCHQQFDLEACRRGEEVDMTEPTEQTKSPLDRVQELFDFLQGTIPDGYKIADDRVPHLSPDQAWTAVWYLGNLYWKVPDFIERCGECGDLYDTRAEGGYTEDGPPYHFCDPCWDQHYLELEREESMREDNRQACRRGEETDMTKEVPTITVDLNKKCRRCGCPGACDNGYCLRCVATFLLQKRKKPT